MSFSSLAMTGLVLACFVFGPGAHAEFDSEFYHARYGLQTPDQKLVNNRGNGYEALYGTRNFREVLKGVMYRGGGNNLWHRDNPRPNHNPLPDDGLQNLCGEGFRTAVYLYSTNFDTAPPVVNCPSIRGANRLDYLQRSFSSRSKEVLDMVHAAINDASKGPLYVHCWNGWHASGMLAAFAYRQFCGWNAAKAVAYWERNTDGTDDGSYESIKRRIRDFRPYPDLAIDAAAAARVCPQ